LKTVRDLTFVHIDKKAISDPAAIWRAAGFTETGIREVIETVSQPTFARSPRVSTACTAHSARSICFESRLKRRLGWHFTSAGAAALPEDAPEPHPQSAMRAAATCQISRAHGLRAVRFV
jgi:hypothetical protein